VAEQLAAATERVAPLLATPAPAPTSSPS